MRRILSVSIILLIASISFIAAASEATFDRQKGDTVFIKDQNGYCYQIMGSGKVGVAPGGNYSGDVVIPSSVTYKGAKYQVTTVRRGAMWKRTSTPNINNLRSVRLPETVTLVGVDAFRGNETLESVTYGRNTRIEVRAFWGCPNLKLKNYPVTYVFTEPYYFYKGPASDLIVPKPTSFNLYLPCEEKNADYESYQWAVYGGMHNSVVFKKWQNFEKESAMAALSVVVKQVRGGVFTFRSSSSINEMCKNADMENLVLAHNNYVGTHDFLFYSPKNAKPISQALKAALVKKYGRKIKSCVEVCHTTGSSTVEQLILTNFVNTKNEAMVVFSWVKGGKEVCAYKMTTTIEPGQDMSVWNVDDEGTYESLYVLAIAKDDKGNLELFLNHPAPESETFLHLVKKGSIFQLAAEEQWYRWVDAPLD